MPYYYLYVEPTRTTHDDPLPPSLQSCSPPTKFCCEYHGWVKLDQLQTYMCATAKVAGENFSGEPAQGYWQGRTRTRVAAAVRTVRGLS